MKHLFALLTLLVVGVLTARGQSSEDQYVRIYNLIQQADALSLSGKPDLALPKYLEAQTSLQRIHKLNPTWQPKVVSFRLRYLEEKISDIPNAKPAAPVVSTIHIVGTPTPVEATPPKPAVVSPQLPPLPEARATSPSPEVLRQMAALQDDLRKLQAEKTILESKLKEAFATQPAAVDPRELMKAQEKIQSLTKENELLKTSLEEEKNTPAKASAKELEETKRALSEAKLKIEEQAAAVAKFEMVRTTLQERMGKLTASAEAAEALRAENELLKKQLADSKASVLSADEKSKRLTEAEARIATLSSDAEVLRLEKFALEARLSKGAGGSSGAKSQTMSRPADLERIRRLEAERDEFIAQIEAANRRSLTGKGKDLTSRVEQLTREVANLRTRVDVFEARAIPYSAEELALFTKPVAKPAALPEEKTTRTTGKEIPATTMALATKAQKHFEAKQYDKAEENYLEILKQDDKSAYSHANLAAIQLEMGRLDEAEKHLKSALETSPNDAHATMLMGLLKFRQEKWDDAIDALGRAAKLAPNNAEVHDNLGVALSQKGLRGPAEQAFRKAMILNPNHAGVQSHLALFYALETPPNIPLARFHYQKAIAAGEARNPDIEKMFDKKEAATK